MGTSTSDARGEIRLELGRGGIRVELGVAQAEESLIVSLDAFQARVRAWSDERLPNREDVDPLLNLQEEVGELSRAVLKGRQKIRFTSQEIAQMKREEAADVLIALLDFCAREGFSLAEVARDLFAKKSHPSYDEARAADKRRRDASDKLVGALSTSLLALRRAGLSWHDDTVQETLQALGAASGFTLEDLVRLVDAALAAEAETPVTAKLEIDP